jgi:hypothetical protein
MSGRDLGAEVAFLTRALKAPTLREAVPRLAERAREQSWSHEEFLIACLQREVSARESHGGEGRIRAARFPARKSLEEFDFDHARGLKRELIAHLGTLDFVSARENVLLLGPPATGKTHLATGLAIRACQAGHRVLFATATEWVSRLAEAHRPRSCPHQMDPAVEVRLVELRGLHPGWGADRLRYRLEREGVDPLPSRAAIGRALIRLGLVGPGRRRGATCGDSASPLPERTRSAHSVQQEATMREKASP